MMINVPDHVENEAAYIRAAQARIRRVGQKHKQLFLHLQSTPVERKIYAMLQKKQRVQEKFLEMFEEASRE